MKLLQIQCSLWSLSSVHLCLAQINSSVWIRVWESCYVHFWLLLRHCRLSPRGFCLACFRTQVRRLCFGRSWFPLWGCWFLLCHCWFLLCLFWFLLCHCWFLLCCCLPFPSGFLHASSSFFLTNYSLSLFLKTKKTENHAHFSLEQTKKTVCLIFPKILRWSFCVSIVLPSDHMLRYVKIKRGKRKYCLSKCKLYWVTCKVNDPRRDSRKLC